MRCFKSYSLIKEFYEKGSTGGVVSTLAFCILKMRLAEGVVCLNRARVTPSWFVARDKSDLLNAAGSTYELVNFSFPLTPGLAQVGKPCDLTSGFSPRVSLFCSHSYRKKRDPISKEYAQLNKPKLKTIFENPMRCFLCLDHLGFSSDLSVGDSHYDRKINVILVHSEVGEQLIHYAVNHKYLFVEKIELREIKKRNSYLWRFRK